MNETMQQLDLIEIAKQFKYQGEIKEIGLYGDGHINTTYKVACNLQEKEFKYILQKINTNVFKDPVHLMENIENVTGYLENMQKESNVQDGYEVLTIVKTIEGTTFYEDKNSGFWRSYIFVDNTNSYTYTDSLEVLYQAARAFGRFQKMLKDYPAQTLNETIQDFHNTSVRYSNLLHAIEEDRAGRVKQVSDEIQFCINHKEYADIIVNALKNGEIPYHVTHNDTKINNVLLNQVTGEGVCVIDLDTVMSGSSLYDYGDSIRSCGAAAEEDETDLSKVTLNLDRYEAYTKGYLEELGSIMSEAEIKLLPYAGIIMTYECGMRFLTDYLNGDIYFRIHRETHNLDRARNQFKLVQDMIVKMKDMEAIVNQYRK